MLKKKGQLRKSKIYLKEHLTTKNNKIFYQARQARDYNLINHVWTDNGRVWATMKEGEDPILLTDVDFLEGMVNEAIVGGAVKRDKSVQQPPPRKPPRTRVVDDSYRGMYRRQQGRGRGGNGGIQKPPRPHGNTQNTVQQQTCGIDERLLGYSGTLSDFPPLQNRERSDFSGQYSVRQNRDNEWNRQYDNNNTNNFRSYPPPFGFPPYIPPFPFLPPGFGVPPPPINPPPPNQAGKTDSSAYQGRYCPPFPFGPNG